MTTNKNDRQNEILKFFKNVDSSDLSVKKYFTTHKTPISLSQYYKLKKRFDQQGIAGIEDNRTTGNAQKLNPQQLELVNAVLTYNRHLTSKSLQCELQNKWGIELDISRIDQLRRASNLTRIKPKVETAQAVKFAGIEIFSALVHHIGILEHWNQTIKKRLQQIKLTSLYQNQNSQNSSHIRHRNGQFSSRYNKLKKVREMKFASIEDKIKEKDFASLSLYQTTDANLGRKNLSVLLLPLVTNNGASKSINKPLGNALQYACGYNYKHSTIDKYLRELKYLQISTDLIDCNAKFFHNFWKQYDSTTHKLACYYIDGNVKPLWSSKRCRKGKVTMLGRVMNCLEQVIIHDGYGHPIYFRTFSGNADLQKYALQSMEELNGLLSETKKPNKSKCTRALIFDSGGNSVQNFRAFSKSSYYYITILDTNQINERKFKHQTDMEYYRYGKAMLTDCRIELLDSKEPKYIYESRAVQVHWTNGRECCLLTSIPPKIFDDHEVVKAYFERWPQCEKQYAMMKAAVCFYQVVGYGKKQVDDIKMLERINEYQTGIQQLKQELEVPISQIIPISQKFDKLFETERELKQKSKIKDGERIQSKRNTKALETCQREIIKLQRQIKKIEEPFKKEFKVLRNKSKEFARIQGKEKVYNVDVELDQLLTSFRLTFANILAFLAKEILNESSIEMNTLIQSILFLSGTIEQLPDYRKVCINQNKKDQKFMTKLSKGLSKLNSLNIRHPSGAIYVFKIV